MKYLRYLILLIVSLVLFGYLTWSNYWKIQVEFNSDALSLYTTPNTFPFGGSDGSNGYRNMIEEGKREMKEKRVIITGLLRDVADSIHDSGIKGIKSKVQAVISQFADYRVLLVENDSTDGTRQLLLEWAREDPKVIILGCGVNERGCTLKLPKTEGHSVDKHRIDKMTYLRNVYLDYVKERYPDWDYLIGWDLDIIGSVYLDGIQNSFGHFRQNPDVNVICANGMYRWFGTMTLYYDTFAHLDWEDNFNIQEKANHDINKGLGVRGNRGDNLQWVRSCFSGFSIYRIPHLVKTNARYLETQQENLLCEHSTLCNQLSGVYMNPSMIYLVIRNE